MPPVVVFLVEQLQHLLTSFHLKRQPKTTKKEKPSFWQRPPPLMSRLHQDPLAGGEYCNIIIIWHDNMTLYNVIWFNMWIVWHNFNHLPNKACLSPRKAKLRGGKRAQTFFFLTFLFSWVFQHPNTSEKIGMDYSTWASHPPFHYAINPCRKVIKSQTFQLHLQTPWVDFRYCNIPFENGSIVRMRFPKNTITDGGSTVTQSNAVGCGPHHVGGWTGTFFER